LRATFGAPRLFAPLVAAFVETYHG
jgi:hypothetical protein